MITFNGQWHSRSALSCQVPGTRYRLSENLRFGMRCSSKAAKQADALCSLAVLNLMPRRISWHPGNVLRERTARCTFGREAAAAKLAPLGKARFSNRSSPGVLLLEGTSSSPAACPQSAQLKIGLRQGSQGTVFQGQRRRSDAELLRGAQSG